MKIHRNNIYESFLVLSVLSTIGLISTLFTEQKWYWILIALSFTIGFSFFSVIWIKNNYLLLSEEGIYSKSFGKEKLFKWDDFILIQIIELYPMMRGIKIKLTTNEDYLVIINQPWILNYIKKMCTEQFWIIFKSEYNRFY